MKEGKKNSKKARSTLAGRGLLPPRQPGEVAEGPGLDGPASLRHGAAGTRNGQSAAGTGSTADPSARLRPGTRSRWPGATPGQGSRRRLGALRLALVPAGGCQGAAPGAPAVARRAIVRRGLQAAGLAAERSSQRIDSPSLAVHQLVFAACTGVAPGRTPDCPVLAALRRYAGKSAAVDGMDRPGCKPARRSQRPSVRELVSNATSKAGLRACIATLVDDLPLPDGLPPKWSVRPAGSTLPGNCTASGGSIETAFARRIDDVNAARSLFYVWDAADPGVICEVVRANRYGWLLGDCLGPKNEEPEPDRWSRSARASETRGSRRPLCRTLRTALSQPR